MPKIYRQSFAFFFASLPVLITFAAVIEAMLWVLQPKSEGAVTFGALAIAAYFIHRHFLFGEPLTFGKARLAPDAPPLKLGWFLAISILMVFVPVGIALIIALTIGDEFLIGIALLAFLFVYLLALSLFGLALPASVARDGTYRMSQGVRATFPTMGRLILGPGLVGFVVLAGMLLAEQSLAGLNLAEDSLLLLAWFVVLRTLGFLSTILAVAVLCEMYRRTRPGPLAGPGLPDPTPDQRPA